MTAKADIPAYPPEYVSRKTLAYLLDMGERTIDDYVSRRVLPEPVEIGGLKRWHWPTVKNNIASKGEQAFNEPDPYDEGVGRVTATEAGNDRAA